MKEHYEPELGQAIFGNSWGQFVADSLVDAIVCIIITHISNGVKFMGWEELKAKGIKLYYEDEYVCIINSDCRDILPQLPDNSVDLVLTDPPYDIQAEVLRRVWEAMYRVMKDKANLVWTFNTCRLQVIGQSLIPELEEIRTAVWHKPFCPSSWRFGWSWHWEAIIWWRRKNNRDGISRYKFDCSDVISIDVVRPTDPQRTSHHDQKPDSLWSQLEAWFSDNGNLILDPFLGSGTTAYCAKKLNRRCIGIEIEEKYCEIAANRCRQMVMDLAID